MDFSQPNKINSIKPPQIQNQNDYYSNMHSQNMNSQHKFMSNSFQHPKCVHQSNNFVPQHHQSMMQTPHESSNRNFMHKMTKNFEPYSFNTSSPESYCLPSSSYFNPGSYSGHEMMEQQQQQQQQQLQPYEDEVNDINVEYFQCAPPIPIRHESKLKPTNPFRPIMESMRKFSDNCVKQPRSDKIGDAANSQTYFYSYDSAKKEEPEQVQRQDEQFYRSFTKIISIPNGVKIITEIKKDDNINDQRVENGNKNSNSDIDKWLNKQIEVTLDNMNVDDCEDGNDNDSSEFCADEASN